MVESKNYLIQAQLALVFLIPVTPHIEISNNLQLDDIPVVLFFVLFIPVSYTHLTLPTNSRV